LRRNYPNLAKSIDAVGYRDRLRPINLKKYARSLSVRNVNPVEALLNQGAAGDLTAVQPRRELRQCHADPHVIVSLSRQTSGYQVSDIGQQKISF
jgi:hypothetical protein